METLRINNNNGSPVIVTAAQLQFKGKRYYFTDTIKLSQGEYSISPFDLNIEHGEVEWPYKPMIRFSTPLVDADGVKRGIVVINYLGCQLLDSLVQRSGKSFGRFMVLNAQGFFLKGEDVLQERGFMFPDGEIDIQEELSHGVGYNRGR